MADKNNFVIKAHSPHNLHPFKGLGMLITIVIFDRKNSNYGKEPLELLLMQKQIGIHWRNPKTPGKIENQDF